MPSRLGPLLAAVVLGAALAGCVSRAAGPADSPAPGGAPGPSQSNAATDVPIHVESEGHVTDEQTVLQHGRQRPLYEIRALSDEGDRSANGNEIATFDQAHITFHAADGNVLIADAPRATVSQRTKDVLMSGGVRAQTRDGAILTCSTLRYDGRTEHIHGEGNVRLTSAQGFELTGDRLDGNVRLDHIHLSQGNAR
jgi:hypothetical protein